MLFEFEFELLFELLFEFEFEFELELELEFELELLLLLLLLLLFELELLFEFELLSEPQSSVCEPFRVPQLSSSAATGAARSEVAMKATVATLVKVFIGGVLPIEKQPSVTAKG